MTPLPVLPLLLVSCGILRKEIRFLMEKNNWTVEAVFLDSALHIDFDKLSCALQKELARRNGRETVVCYGACHPCMDSYLSSAKTIRTEGQNCVEMLLGPEQFTRELSHGAYFLLEDWAWRWERIMTATCGTNREVMREILQGDRSYLLCLKTPCSGDFGAEAAKVADMAGLPMRWVDVSLDHLEKVLNDVMNKKLRGES